MRRRSAPSTDLDLVPVMNLATVLIPLLLMGAWVAHVATIDVDAPAPGDGDGPPPVTLLLDGDGYHLRGDGVDEEIACRTPLCAGLDTWDTDGLRAALGRLKDARPDASLVVVAADHVPYDALILTLDAAREDPGAPGDGTCRGRCLFPDVAVGVAAP